jgi:hypothetical protein
MGLTIGQKVEEINVQYQFTDLCNEFSDNFVDGSKSYCPNVV